MKIMYETKLPDIKNNTSFDSEHKQVHQLNSTD